MKTILKVVLLVAASVRSRMQFIARPDRINPAEDPALTMSSQAFCSC